MSLTGWRDEGPTGAIDDMSIQRTTQLLNDGLNHRQLTASARRGEYVRVRHGAWSQAAAAGDVEQHKFLIAGTWPLLGDQAILSHDSAAVLHGLPVWRSGLERVSITRASGGHGGRTRHLRVQQAPITAGEVVELSGYRVTSLERTAFDLARTLSYERAVAVLDAALHAKAEPQVLADLAQQATNRRGVGVARRALAFADRRAESVAESISRVRMAEVGLPAPELQFEVVDHGIWIARVDFAWLDCRVVGEFDGRVKYAGTPDQVAQAVMDEKARHSALEDAGWIIVRWTWSELFDRPRFRARIQTALDDGRKRRRLI